VADRLHRSSNGKAKGSGLKESRSTKGSYILCNWMGRTYLV